MNLVQNAESVAAPNLPPLDIINNVLLDGMKVVGELFGAQAGLGFLIYTAGQTFDVPSLFVGIVTLAVAGVGLTFAAELVERHVLRWRKTLRLD